MNIRIGCSGWSYPEWSGTFYPKSTKPSLRLYSSFFNTVEVNSTFYKVPQRENVESWLKQLSKDSDFKFSVKAPAEFTHPFKSDDIKKRLDVFTMFVENVLVPIKNSGRMAMTMFGLPPWIGKTNFRSELKLIREVTEGWMNPFVEPRNRALVSGNEFFNACTQSGLGAISVDSPDHVLTDIFDSNKLSYVRLHGRNRRKWNEKGAGMEKYNYKYTEQEVEEFVNIIQAKEVSEIMVYFNNHPLGNAPVNAIALGNLLGIKIKTYQSMLS